MVDFVAGTPIRQAEVTLTGGFIGNNPNVSTATDDDGRFGFQGLPPGDYFILVRKQGYELNQALDDPMPAVVLLSNHGVNLQLRLVAEASIAGQIVDETGRRLSGIPVAAQRFVDGPVPKETRAKAITNEHGEYRLSRLIPGRYRVVTAYIFADEGTSAQQLTGYSMPARSYRGTFYPGTVDPRAATSLDVVAGAHLEHVDFALDGGDWYQVRGRILVTGRQVGPGRLPSLKLVPRVPQAAPLQYSHDVRHRVGEEHRFVIRDVMPGLYDLRVTWHYQGKDYSSQTEVVVGSSDLDNVVLEVGPRAGRRQD